MVYVEMIENSNALIFEGPVIYDQIEPHIFTSSNLDDVKDSLELKYISEKEAEVPYFRHNYLMHLLKIDKHLGNPGSGRRLLDFGSGFGFFLATAKERNWDAYGIEPLPASSVYARAKFGLNIVTDTLRENTFPEGFFDVITSFQVFEHIPHPYESVKCLARSLKEGGLILIEVPCFDTWTMRLLGPRHRHFVQDHINFFSYDTLQNLLKKNGIDVIDNYYPKRTMSLQHMYDFWIANRLPKTISMVGRGFLHRRRLLSKTIRINLGDILAVIGRKN
jgi:SAM-dependent methyltransferase